VSSPRHPSISNRCQIIERIGVLADIAGNALGAGTRRHLREGEKRLREARFNLVVLGEFKRGKSTLINALLGVDVLPTGVVPLTSAVTVVRSGVRSRLIVAFADGREREHPISGLARFVTEQENPGNRLGVEHTIVELSAEILGGGLQIVDTPGIGSVHAHNTDVAWEYMPSVDAALCVLAADQPFAAAEREFFRAAAARAPRVLLVVNKVDHLKAAELEAAIDFIRAATAELLGTMELELYPVSARTGVGLPALRDRIAGLAERESETLVVRSVGALAAGAAASAAQAVRFEAHAIELPLAELACRAERFNERARALRAAGAQAAVLLGSGVDRVLENEVNAPLLRFAQDNAAELEQKLADRVGELHGLPARELGPALDTWVDEMIRERFGTLVPELEAAIAAEVRSLQQSFATRIRTVLTEIQDAADETFGARAGVSLPEVDFSTPASFTFKLADVAHMLDSMVSFGRRTIPGELGRRMVTRDARDRLLHMADRHAGRLRSALVDRVRQAVKDYERELTRTVDEAVRAITATVARVSEERAGSAPEVARRRDELLARARRLEELRDELAELVAIEAERDRTQPRATTTK